MGTFSDVAELKIRILGAEAKKDLEALKAGAKEIKQELHLLEMAGEKGGESWKQLKLLQRDVNNEMKGYTKNIDLSNASMNELRARKAQLNKELGVLKVGTKEWMDKLKEIEPVNAKIKETGERIKDATGEAKQLGEATEKVGGAWGRIKEFFAGNVIADAVRNILSSTQEFVLTGINKAAEMTDLFAGIQKTTGMSRMEVEGLNAELGKIDTRTAQSELLKIGQVGGQIGVAKDEMMGFVEATNMAVVALGDEFGGGTEEVTKSLGTLKQIFKETKEMEFGQALQGIGSALNELGAAGMATAPVVADFAQRVGALGDLSPQISQTMGLGAAFQELGLTAEISSGGIANILLTAAKRAEDFGRQLGITTGEFEELIRNSPNEMLLKLAESFRGMKVDEVAKALAGLGINSQEATKVISLLATNTDMVREKQELASVAMREATSLTKEYNVVNETEAAQLEKSRKALEAKQVAMGTALLPTYIKLTQAGTSFIGFLADNWAMITKLGTALVAYTGLQKAYVLWTERQVAVTGIKNAIDQVKLVLEGRKILSLQAQAAGMNVLTAAETRAAAAANAFNASLNRNVAILAITVLIVGLMEAYNQYSKAVELAEQRSLSHIKATDEEIKAEQRKQIAVEKSFKATMDLAYGTDERKKAIEGLMKAYPGYFGKLDAEQVSNWHLEQAYRRVNSQIQNKIELMAREKQVANITNQLVDLRVDQMNNDGGGAWIGRYQNQQQQLKLTQQLENAEKGLNNTRVKGFNQEMSILNERLKNGSLVYSDYMKENNALRQKHEIGGRIFTQNEILDRQQKEMGKSVVNDAKAGGDAVEAGEGRKMGARRKAADETVKMLEKLSAETKKAHEAELRDFDKMIQARMNGLMKSAQIEREQAEKLSGVKVDATRAAFEYNEKMELAGKIGRATTLEEIEGLEKEYEAKRIARSKRILEDKIAKQNEELVLLKAAGLLTVDEEIKRKTEIVGLEAELTNIKIAESEKRVAEKKKGLAEEIKASEEASQKETEIAKKSVEDIAMATSEWYRGLSSFNQQLIQAALYAFDKMFEAANNYFDKIIENSEDTGKRAGAMLGKEMLKPFEENISASKALLQGDLIGAVEGLFGYFKGMFDMTFGMKKTIKEISEIEFQRVFKERFEELAIFDDAIKATFGSFIKAIEDADNAGYSSKQKTIAAEIELGNKITQNYETAVSNENQLHDTRLRNIESEYSAAVRAINDRYNLERSLADAAFAAANLAIDENTNKQLAAMVTNAESSLSITEEYEGRKNFVREQFAELIRPITADMTQAEIDGINAAVAAQNEAFARIEQWYKDELTFILGNEEQKRRAYTETEEIIRAGEELKQQNSIAFIAAQVERETNRNIELQNAEATKNASIEAEAVRHNDVLKNLAIAKDNEMRDSFNRLKDAYLSGYAEMESAAYKAYSAGVLTLEQYQRALEQLQQTKQMFLSGMDVLPVIQDRFDVVEPTGPDGQPLAFSKGSEYVDKYGMHPAGIDQVPAMLNRGERVLTTDHNLLLGAMSNDDVVKGAVLYRTMGAAMDQGLAALDQGLADQLSNSDVHKSGSHVAKYPEMIKDDKKSSGTNQDLVRKAIDNDDVVKGAVLYRSMGAAVDQGLAAVDQGLADQLSNSDVHKSGSHVAKYPEMIKDDKKSSGTNQDLVRKAIDNDDVVKGAVLYRTMGAAVDQGLAAQLSNSVVHRSGSHVATAAGQVINYVTGASGGKLVSWEGGKLERGGVGSGRMDELLAKNNALLGAVLSALREQTPELRKIRDRTGISLHDIVEAEGKLKEVERMSDF